MSDEYAARIMPAFPQGARYVRIIWPFYYWQALVPERVTVDMPDVFERLYAALEKLDPKVDAKEVFHRLGIDNELYRAVETTCREDGIGAETAKWRKTEIYLFRDAVTGTLIPELTLRSLPREQKIHMGAEDLQSLSPCTSPDCPDALELEQLLKEFRYNHTFLQENPEDVDFDDPYVIETLNAWNDNDDEESDTWDDMDLWDDGFPGMTQTDGELPSALQIHDRYAGKIKMQLYLYIDPRHPEDIHVATPFPNVPRLFFDRILNTPQAEELQETIQFAREMMEEHPEPDMKRQMGNEFLSEDSGEDTDVSQKGNETPLEDVLSETEEILTDDMPEAEEPVLEVEEPPSQAAGAIKLIKAHEELFSQERYHLFKQEVENLALDYENLTVHHVSVYDQFCLHCGTLLEALTRYLVLSVDRDERKDSAKTIQYSAFDAQVADILQKLGQTGFEGLIHANPKSVALALIGKNNRKGSAKELMIGLAIDAVAQKRETQKAFQSHPSLVKELFTIYNQRNEKAHFNEKDAEEQKEREHIATDVYERITQLSDVLIQAYLHPHVTDK